MGMMDRSPALHDMPADRYTRWRSQNRCRAMRMMRSKCVEGVVLAMVVFLHTPGFAAGLDIYHSVASYLNADLSTNPGVSSAITERVEKGDLGIKSGRGLFEYEADEIPALMQKRMKLLLASKKALLGD